MCLAAGVAGAQTPTAPTPKARPVPADRSRPPTFPPSPGPDRGGRDTIEKAMAADPNVAVKLCISEGAVKINGWERNEVRVFVRNGRSFDFRSLEKDPETGKPNWVWITGASPAGVSVGPSSQCLAGDSVELDVPMRASIGLEARTSGAEIDSVRKVNVKIVEGSISLRNIPGGVSAEAFQGDVSIESSSGQISLQSTTGNILAFDVKPGQVGELLKARTNSGNIALQNVSHRQIEANSITGSVSFDGKFLAGGLYNFKTSNGAIRLLLPDDTVCRISASYGFGTFNSTFPLEYLTENLSSGGKSFTARIGKADTPNVTLTTSSGSIGIRKQN